MKKKLIVWHFKDSGKFNFKDQLDMSKSDIAIYETQKIIDFIINKYHKISEGNFMFEYEDEVNNLVNCRVFPL